MAAVDVSLETGDRFTVRIRTHTLTVDQPRDAGGTDAGPAPTELFAASLAACVAFYAERYLRRHDLPTEELAVHCDFHVADTHPARVDTVHLAVDLPDNVPATELDVLRRVVERCTVQNTLRDPPDVRISLRVSQLLPAAWLG
jgi:putative redox protein